MKLRHKLCALIMPNVTCYNQYLTKRKKEKRALIKQPFAHPVDVQRDFTGSSIPLPQLHSQKST